MEKKRTVPAILSILFILFGLYFLYLGTAHITSYQSQRPMPAPQTWQAATGKVSTIVIETRQNIPIEKDHHPENRKSTQEKASSQMGQNENKTFQPLTEDQVRQLVNQRIDDVFTTLNDLGELYGWNFQNPSDYERIKNDLQPFVSDSFASEELKMLADHYYCNCDRSFRPFYTGNVGFSYQQLAERQIHATVLEPANNMDNSAYLWTIELLLEDGRWKLHKLTSKPLGNRDLQLTIADAEELLEYEYQGDAIYLKTFESREAGGTAYLFKVVTPYMEFYSAISARNTKLVDDYS